MLTKKIIVLAKYSDFEAIFSKKLVADLPKRFGINKYTINLQKNKQSHYMLIYSLRYIELETFKTYIKTNLTNSFI